MILRDFLTLSLTPVWARRVVHPAAMARVRAASQRARVALGTGLTAATLLAGCAGPSPDVAPVANKSTGSHAQPTRAGGEAANAPTPPNAGTRTVTVVPVTPAEPTTVVVARPVEPVGPANLWDRIRNGFAMPPLDVPQVADRERYYLDKPEYLQRMFGRGNLYLYYIVDEVEKRGMPTELALLPFVESAMNPTALSSAQAAGLWQFIPSTGKQYNLSQNWWVDNRRDIVRSTQAALDYLQMIYAMHGNDWFLALASYNWGENAVARAVEKNRVRGRPTDYANLDMPAETRNYVPKLIALKNIILRANEYGIALPDLPNKPYFVTIEKTGPIDLKLAAQFAGMTVPEFIALNPAHNRPVIAATRNNEIKLPADRLDAFMEAVERHGAAGKPFASWQPHTLGPGETLEAVAQRANITVAELRTANSLSAGVRPITGTRIIAPLRRAGAQDDETRIDRFEGPRVYEEFRRPAVYHHVAKGETLYSIASRYSVAAGSLQSMNGLKTASVHRGMSLLVRPPSSMTTLTDERGAKQVVATSFDDVKPMRVSADVPAEPAVPPAAASGAPGAAAVAAARQPALPAAAPVAAVARSAHGRGARPTHPMASASTRSTVASSRTAVASHGAAGRARPVARSAAPVQAAPKAAAATGRDTKAAATPLPVTRRLPADHRRPRT